MMHEQTPRGLTVMCWAGISDKGLTDLFFLEGDSGSAVGGVTARTYL